MASPTSKDLKDTVKCEETVGHTAEVQTEETLEEDRRQITMEPKLEKCDISVVPPEKSSVQDGVTENVEGCCACHHLYQSQPSDLVLSAAGLVHAASGLMDGPQGRPHTCYGSISSPTGQQQRDGQGKDNKSFAASVTAGRLWLPRGYESMCECGEGQCRCPRPAPSALPSRLLPRNKPWWPRLKCGLLVVAALVPWVFLVAYLVLYYVH